MKKLLVLLALLVPCVVAGQVTETASALFVKSAGNRTLEIEPGGTGNLQINLPASTLRLPISSPAAGTAATTTASSGTIDTTLLWNRVTNAGAITGVILEAGTVHGQVVVVSVDKDAVGSVTMAAEGTSNACAGTATVLAIGGGGTFIWDATDTCWAEIVN